MISLKAPLMSDWTATTVAAAEPEELNINMSQLMTEQEIGIPGSFFTLQWQGILSIAVARKLSPTPSCKPNG
ncbi:unnamed protein product [Dibothriocephalus latus]|uniref:Uncharacterized protein n=1 Tax=Dibothriocephalus latus TaxID=60516 RepID=A0A3P6QEB2_DIBLA|nr:unnamed protein product [Dibothriocephalus latus]